MLLGPYRGNIMNDGCLQQQHYRSPSGAQTLLGLETMELGKLPRVGGDGEVEGHAQHPQHERTREERHY